MKISTLALAVILSLSFTIQGCKSTATNESKTGNVLATVNGAPITGDDVFLRLGGHEQFIDSPVRDEVLDEVINDELLYQKGVKLGLDKDEKFQSAVRMMERRITAYKRAEIARRVRDTQIAAKVNMTDQDVKEYYGKHAEQIATELHLGVLQFADKAAADEALARIRAGASFEKVGAEQPKGPGQNWDKGFLHWNQIPIEIADTVYGLKKGEVSGVLTASPAGIFIIKVIDRKKNPKTEFANVKAVLENRLIKIKIQEAYDQYLQKLKKESTIKKFEDSRKAS